ncbi:MAG: pilus assembly protein PilM [Bacilli bacterium]|nr:pilus assembly protein PilM [Bacilli bacterium]
MRHIYASLDIGTDTIKLIVCEYFHGRYNLLASSCVKSSGIRKGLISDVNQAKVCIKKAFDEIKVMLGFEVNKVVAIIPSYFADFTMINGEVEIENKVSGNDVIKVFQNAMKDSVLPTKEMVTIMPIDFTADEIVTKDPIGITCSKLKTRAVMVTTPKNNIYSVVGILNNIGVEVVDISLGCIGDIYTLKNDDVNKNVTAVINIGYEKTEVSLYNKGIIVKHNIINIGSKNVDSDISYMYKIDTEKAIELKEKFALAHKNGASLNEVREVKNKLGETIKINQYEISEVVSSRIDEILTLANKEINSLTSRKPEVIILTGGITNMINFNQICREKLGNCAIIGNVSLTGARNNKYSSSIGNIIYFVEKLKLKGKNYSMITEEDMEILSTPRKTSTNDTMLGKVFGYFFGE